MKKLINKHDIISIMEIWQHDEMNSRKLVHVTHFNLEPQAQGFHLNLEFYIADRYDPEMGYDKKSFFGSLYECFDQALNYLESETKRLRTLL